MLMMTDEIYTMNDTFTDVKVPDMARKGTIMNESNKMNDMDVDWAQEIIESANDVNEIATRDYLYSHTVEQVRLAYDTAMYDLYFAAYNYQRNGGQVDIDQGDIVGGWLRYGTIDDIRPVKVEFKN